MGSSLPPTLKGNPWLMRFYGSVNTDLVQMYYWNFMEIADFAGFLILIPEGTLGRDGYADWNVGFASDSDSADLAFNSIPAELSTSSS